MNTMHGSMRPLSAAAPMASAGLRITLLACILNLPQLHRYISKYGNGKNEKVTNVIAANIP